MKWRIAAYSLLSAALAGLVVWVALHTYWDTDTRFRPARGEAATNRFYALEHAARALGTRTRIIASLRVLPPTSNTLLIAYADETLFANAEPSLRRWVEEGGRLVLSRRMLLSSATLRAWSGVKARVSGAQERKRQRAEGRQRHSQHDDSDCGPLAVEVNGKPTEETLSVCAAELNPLTSDTFPPQWSLSSPDGLVALRIAIGDGSVAVFNPEWALDNEGFVVSDHALMLFQLAPLRRGDTLTVLNVAGAENLLGLIWRHAAAAVVLSASALVLLIWRQMPRFGPPLRIPATARRSLAEQIRANARFAWRTRHLAALLAVARRALESTARRQIGGYASLPFDRRVAEIARHSGVDPTILRTAMATEAEANRDRAWFAIGVFERARRQLASNNHWI